MVMRHVEAETLQGFAYCLHESRRTAAEYFTLQVIRRHEAEHQLIDRALEAGPEMIAISAFHDPFQINPRQAGRHVFQPFPEDDLRWPSCTVYEDDIRFVPEIEHVGCHRHHWRDAGAG